MKIQNLPDWEVDWNDMMPQCSRSSLSIDHFLLSTDDAKALEESAMQYIMEFLVEEFSSLSDLKCYVPERKGPHPVTTPTIAPMSILFKDEKYKAATIEIMQQLIKDAKLSGTPEVIAIVE